MRQTFCISDGTSFFLFRSLFHFTYVHIYICMCCVMSRYEAQKPNHFVKCTQLNSSKSFTKAFRFLHTFNFSPLERLFLCQFFGAAICCNAVWNYKENHIVTNWCLWTKHAMRSFSSVRIGLSNAVDFQSTNIYTIRILECSGLISANEFSLKGFFNTSSSHH